MTWSGDEYYDDDVTSGLLDTLARRGGFAMTRAEAARLRACVRCGAPQTVAWTALDMAEWRITYLCPGCFDRITAEPDPTQHDRD